MSPRPIPAALAALSFVLALSGCGPKAPVAAPKETTPAALPDDVKPLETALAPAPAAGPAAAPAAQRVLPATGAVIPPARSELVPRGPRPRVQCGVSARCAWWSNPAPRGAALPMN